MAHGFFILQVNCWKIEPIASTATIASYSKLLQMAQIFADKTNQAKTNNQQ